LQNQGSKDAETALGSGEPVEVDGQLASEMYSQLRRLATQFIVRQKPGQTLQATDLVHETFLRIEGRGSHTWSDKAHFYRAAAQAMRHILIDRARKRKAVRHGGDRMRLELQDDHARVEEATEDLLILNEALERLRGVDERMYQIVMLRYFAGLTLEQTAEVAGVSLATAKRDWAFAKAWLFEDMSDR
jgi:RNA polymerase sigma factor (TIGR02999 family)